MERCRTITPNADLSSKKKKEERPVVLLALRRMGARRVVERLEMHHCMELLSVGGSRA